MRVRGRALGIALVLMLVFGCTGGAGGSTAGAPAGATPSGVAAATPAAAGGGGGGASGGPIAAGGDLCGLLGPGDFAAVGVAGTGHPSENNPDASNAYCVYAGKSAGTGGVEFDAFLAGSAADSQASYASVSAPMLDFAKDGQKAFPGADGAAIRTDIPGGYAGIAIWQGKLVFDIGIPPSDHARDQLIALAKLVLQRAANLT